MHVDCVMQRCRRTLDLHLCHPLTFSHTFSCSHACSHYPSVPHERNAREAAADAAAARLPDKATNPHQTSKSQSGKESKRQSEATKRQRDKARRLTCHTRERERIDLQPRNHAVTMWVRFLEAGCLASAYMHPAVEARLHAVHKRILFRLPHNKRARSTW